MKRSSWFVATAAVVLCAGGLASAAELSADSQARLVGSVDAYAPHISDVALAIWAALLRLPMYGVCSLILAAGLARPISDAVATRGSNPRSVRYTML